MKYTAFAAVAAISAFAITGAAWADTPVPAAAKAAPAQHSAAYIECSKQAEAKGLHHHARKEYIAKCSKDAAAPSAK
jgi:hypothetical protein